MGSTARAGRLRHKVTIEHCVQTPDGQGGRSTEWFAVGRVSVGIEQASNIEVFRAAKQNNIITHMIEARYTPLIDNKSRLVLKKKKEPERTFQVVAIDNVRELNRKLMISAKEAQ